MQPSKRWASTGADQSTEVFPTIGGWYLDGVVYGDKMEPQLVVGDLMDRENLIGHTLMTSGEKRNDIRVRTIACRSFPITARIVWNRQLAPKLGSPISLEINTYQKRSPLGTVEVGHVGHQYFLVDDKDDFLRWDNTHLRSFEGPRFGWHERTRTSFFGSNNGMPAFPAAMTSSRNRIVVASSGTLHRVDLDDSILGPRDGVVALMRKQSKILVLGDEDVTLTHSVMAPTPGVTFSALAPSVDGELEIQTNQKDGTVQISSSQLQAGINRLLATLSPQQLQTQETYATKLYKQVTGTRPRRPVFAQPVTVSAKVGLGQEASSDTLKYNLIVETSDEIAGIVESKKKKIAANTEAKRRTVEKDKQDQLEDAYTAELTAYNLWRAKMIFRSIVICSGVLLPLLTWLIPSFVRESSSSNISAPTVSFGLGFFIWGSLGMAACSVGTALSIATSPLLSQFLSVLASCILAVVGACSLMIIGAGAKVCLKTTSEPSQRSLLNRSLGFAIAGLIVLALALLLFGADIRLIVANLELVSGLKVTVFTLLLAMTFGAVFSMLQFAKMLATSEGISTVHLSLTRLIGFLATISVAVSIAILISRTLGEDYGFLVDEIMGLSIALLAMLLGGSVHVIMTLKNQM